MSMDVIGGRYELQKRIGVGGVADVYLAVDRLLGREVAIKILNDRAAGDPNFAERFRREARAAAALNHPHIVSIFDWGESSGDSPNHPKSYLVMEYVPGPDLKQLLRQSGPLTEAEALEIGAQVAGALQAAHRRGIIHRDVKPHNILIDPEGRAAVTDFGIASVAGATDLTAPNVIYGTAQYLSPEQAQGGQLDARSDVYALGVLLFEMLTGHPPFSGASLVDVALQHIHSAPPDLRGVRPDISATTGAATMKALAKNPADRFQTADEMRQALLAAKERPLADPLETTQHVVVDKVPTTTTVHAGRTSSVRPPVDTNHSSGPGSRQERGIAPWIIGVPVLASLLVGAGILTFQVVAASLLGPTLHGGHTRQSAVHIQETSAAVSPTSRPASSATSRSVVQPSSVPAVPTIDASVPARVSPTSVPTTSSSSPLSKPAKQSSASGRQIAGTDSPVGAVESFYQLISAGQYDAAAQLWTPGLRQQDPPATYIDQRFANTTSIIVRSADMVDRHGNNATVAVDLIETSSSPPGTRELHGTWQLVRDQGTWLMDSPAFG